MAATVTIRRWTGTTGSPTKTNVTAITTKLHAADVHYATGDTNAVRVPESGTNYSYWGSFRLSVDAITGGTVDNIRFYSDGSNTLGTGLGLVGNTATAYIQATGTAGTTGTELTTGNHANLAGAPVNAFTWTAGSPLAVTGTTSTTGDLGHFVVVQLTVGTTAANPVGTETLTFLVDDTSS